VTSSIRDIRRYKEIYRKKRIVCLYIPDEYDYMDPELIALLEQRLPRYRATAESRPK